jgi:hypothetical protein
VTAGGPLPAVWRQAPLVADEGVIQRSAQRIPLTDSFAAQS